MMRSELAFSLRQMVWQWGTDTILDIVELDIPAGQVTAVVGPNGAGKTSLLEVLAGLRQPRAQRFMCLGQECSPGTPAWEQLRRRVTYVAQRPWMFRRSVYANVAYGLRLRGTPERERVWRALERVGLAAYAERPAWTLSAGEMQRVAIARALAIEPPILLFDEPTANLDRDFVPIFEDLVRELVADGRTVLFSTHLLDQAYRLGERIVSLEGGRVVPFPFANLLRGAVRADGSDAVLDAGSLQVVLPWPVPGMARATVAVDPESILLSRERFESSARNTFGGVVVRIEGSEAGLLVHVDCGVELVARITARAFAQLGLAIGDRVFVTFKSTAVHWIEPPLEHASRASWGTLL